MKNNFDELFDENAKNLFQGFEMDFNPQDWSKMERQLNKSDEKFDANARQKLENYEMPYNKQDWAKMETLLDKNRHRARYFWFYKTLEFSFVSLFLLGSFLFFGEQSQPQPDNNLAFNNSNGKNTNSNAANSNSNGKNTNSNATNNNSNGKNTNSNGTNSNSNGKNTNFNGTNSNSNGKNTNSSATNSNSNGKNTNSNGTNSNSNGKNTNSNTTNSNSNGKNTKNRTANTENRAANTENRTTNTENRTTNTENRTINTENRTANTENPTLNQLLLLKNADLTDKIQANNGDEDEKITAASLKKVKLALPFVRQVRLSAVAGMETHSENSFGRGTASFLGGASLETDINRHFALSFGLQYARRNHELELNSQETSAEGLIYNLKESRNTHLSIVQIPIALQTNVFRNEKWRVYLTSGFNASLIFDKTYSGTLQINVPQAAGNTRMQTNISPREYEGGLFQTGNFMENAFLTAQIGAGAERQLTDHFSLFVQPTYQISFTRFGQNRQDKTRVISLNVGVKTNF